MESKINQVAVAGSASVLNPTTIWETIQTVGNAVGIAITVDTITDWFANMLVENTDSVDTSALLDSLKSSIGFDNPDQWEIFSAGLQSKLGGTFDLSNLTPDETLAVVAAIGCAESLLKMHYGYYIFSTREGYIRASLPNANVLLIVLESLMNKFPQVLQLSHILNILTASDKASGTYSLGLMILDEENTDSGYTEQMNKESVNFDYKDNDYSCFVGPKRISDHLLLSEIFEATGRPQLHNYDIEIESFLNRTFESCCAVNQIPRCSPSLAKKIKSSSIRSLLFDALSVDELLNTRLRRRDKIIMVGKNVIHKYLFKAEEPITMYDIMKLIQSRVITADFTLTSYFEDRYVDLRLSWNDIFEAVSREAKRRINFSINKDALYLLYEQPKFREYSYSISGSPYSYWFSTETVKAATAPVTALNTIASVSSDPTKEYDNSLPNPSSIEDVVTDNKEKLLTSNDTSSSDDTTSNVQETSVSYSDKIILGVVPQTKAGKVIGYNASVLLMDKNFSTSGLGIAYCPLDIQLIPGKNITLPASVKVISISPSLHKTVTVPLPLVNDNVRVILVQKKGNGYVGLASQLIIISEGKI